MEHSEMYYLGEDMYDIFLLFMVGAMVSAVILLGAVIFIMQRNKKMLNGLRQRKKLKQGEREQEKINNTRELFGSEKKAEEKREQEEKKSNPIPATCPHCKNPNTKKLRECEWCGNEI